ncbi:Atu4866 domain-containing protein [Prauserella rugosa]
MSTTAEDSRLEGTTMNDPTPGGSAPDGSTPQAPTTDDPARPDPGHPYVGMWVTADGHIRQELLPDGRYDEARGARQSAYTGRYRVAGERIEYRDDTGFSADGEFDGDVLHHGGYVFYREGSPAHRRAVDGAS